MYRGYQGGRESELRIASRGAISRIHEDLRERIPKRYRPSIEYALAYLYAPWLTVGAIQRETGTDGNVRPFLGRTLKFYISEARVETATSLFESTDLLTFEVGEMVGIPEFSTLRNTYRKHSGKNLPIVHHPDRLEPSFNGATWARLVSGKLSPVEIATLSRLLEQKVPCRPADTAPDTVVLWIQDRIRSDARYIKDRNQCLARVLDYTADHLFSGQYMVKDALASTHDGSTSTRFAFYFGDSIREYARKRQIEAAVLMFENENSTIDEVTDYCGINRDSFARMFSKRTEYPISILRRMWKSTSGDVDFSCWRRAGECKVSDEDRQRVGLLLRGSSHGKLLPEALAVRKDINPSHVEDLVRLKTAIEWQESELSLLSQVLKTHPDYSAAHWYLAWIQERLGEVDAGQAWDRWLAANRALTELLEAPEPLRVHMIRDNVVYRATDLIWVTVDAIFAELFNGTAFSEQLTELNLVMAECDTGDEPGLYALALVLKGNALLRRQEMREASDLIERAVEEVDTGKCSPWICGTVLRIASSLLIDGGKAREARRMLLRASRCLRDTSDILAYTKCAIKRSMTWFSLGVDSSRLLSHCIEMLRDYPFEKELMITASINRALSYIYLNDGMRGKCSTTLLKYVEAVPAPEKPYAVATYRQLNGLVKAVDNRPREAAKDLLEAASWFEEQGMRADAAVCLLQYAWALLDHEDEQAFPAALAAYEHFRTTGFTTDGLLDIARKISIEAKRGLLKQETLRKAVLLAVCPKLEAKL